MDHPQYTTEYQERKKGQHLRPEDRGAIKAYKKAGYSNRAIARELRCSPTTIGNELKRGTPPRRSNRGKAPGYSPKRGEAVYRANRAACRKPHKVSTCARFQEWVVERMRKDGWSFDACCGYAKRMKLFSPSEMVCTKTLYNMAWAGKLPVTLFELPEVLKRKSTRHRERKHKKCYGTSISERPEVVSLRTEEGHWEGDTVVGKRAGKESVVFSLLEKKTQNYLAFRIPGKTVEAIQEAMNRLKEEYGDRFSQVFKTITVDNGSEFANYASIEAWGTRVYYAHPYTSSERGQNERHNGLFRRYVPKGASMEEYTDEEILMFADKLNGMPRRNLGYHTPEELFDAFLDRVFAA